MKMRTPRLARVKWRFQAMARWHSMVKRGKDTLKSKTPSLALAKSLVCTRTLTQSLTPGRRSSPSSRSSTNPAPKRACLPRTRVGHLPRKSSQLIKHSMTRPGKELSSWTQISMLGSARRLLKASQAGPPETMICDLLKHGKVQPNHPDPVGPPLDYMGKRQVFNGIRSDIYNLCWFYILGTTGDLPEFPTPREPATCGQIRDLLKLAHAIGRPYMILVHSADSVTAISMLRELHTATCLQCLQVNLQGKLVKLSFCPFCAYVGGRNDLSYLNHIIIAHYNASYGCRKCLKQAFVSSPALHKHKKVCLGLISRKSTGGSDSKPSSGRGGNSSHGGSSKATPKKDGKAPATDCQGSSTPPASQPSPHHSGQETFHHHKSHKNWKDSGEKKKYASPAGKNKVCKDSGCH